MDKPFSSYPGLRNTLRKTSLSALAVLAGLSMSSTPATAQGIAAGPSQQTVRQLHGLDPALRDTSTDPCVNFYQYACGGWLRANPIPADQSSYGRDTEVEERNRLVLRTILEKASALGGTRSPDEQKIGDYYATCMDTTSVETRSPTELKPALAVIDAMRSKDELPAVVAHLQLLDAPALFGFGSEQDFKDAQQEIAVFSQARLGLPEKGYYLRTDAKSVELRKQYTAHVSKMFTLLGEPEADAAKDAQVVLDFETQLAKVSLSREEERNPKNVYHPTTLPAFAAQNRSFDMDRFLAAMHAPSPGKLNVAMPGYFAGLDALLSKTDLAQIKTLLRWNLIHGTPGTALPHALDEEQFHFYGNILSGQPEQKPRWKRCIDATDGALGEALGKVYVEQQFSAADKQRTLEITRDIEKAMGHDLTQLPWMSDQTKARAQEKLAAINNKVGYPDKWRDYSKLEIARGDALGNAYRAATFENARDLAKIGKPVDKGEWSMSPPTVNAYYNPLMNDVNFPAGILQPPYFDPAMNDAVNYGEAGATEGHELTHGFDDEGRQFDAHGNFDNWWTAADGKKFDERADCVAKEYGGFVAVDDLHLNGKLTLGENLADLGGLRLGYLAWMERQSRPGATKDAEMDGMTPVQQFFTAYAQGWCQNNRPEELRLRVQTDPHSPEEFRVNGVVVNMPEFQQAFGCKAGQPMVSQNRCSVW